MNIHKLPVHIIHHIAAGEVIDRPSSIIKELVENSLDATATRIEIELLGGGLESINVTDNGTGILTTDIPLVFERYATSKLTALDQLLSMHTFGFRGEALFSIMSIGNVILKTRHQTESVGTEIRTFGGSVDSSEPVGYRQGTALSISNVFDRFPVRKQRLQKKKELQHIVTLVEHFILANPQIGFTLKNDRKTLISSFEQESLELRLEKFWKLNSTQTAHIAQENLYGKLDCWISKPEFSFSSAKHQIIVINSRLITDTSIQKALYQSLKTFFHRNQHPQYILRLELQPELLDINIHPQKKEIKYLHQEAIIQFITDSCTTAFDQALPDEFRYRASTLFPTLSFVKEESPSYSVGTINSVQQLNDVYILATVQNGFLLIDQHAADERLWYNRLLKDNTLLKTIESKVSKACIEELEDDIYQHSFEPNINNTVATIACHQAIRAGQKLSDSQMVELAKQTLSGGSDTLVCPHGRPTHMFVSISQLEKVFRRT